MNDHLKEFLSLLNAHEVEYVVIGAHALAFHGFPRYTEDLDLWLSKTSDNARRLALALEEFGTPMPPGGEEAWVSGRRMIRLGLPPNRVDILNFGADLPFEEVWNRRTSANFDEVVVPMIARTDFIKAKRDAARPKDLRDLEEMGESDA